MFVSRFLVDFVLSTVKSKNMKSISVTYTVKKEFVQKNNENIKLFLKDVRKIASPDMQYLVLLAEDGVTLSHLSIYKNESLTRKIEKFHCPDIASI